jgi:AcrR family transcriptional regulator
VTALSAAPGSPVRPRAPGARGAQTRERILDTAERLWGERGLNAVSLREIRIAAGQRNSSALQFHFGDRPGLMQAVAERHLPRVAALQEQLYTDAVAEGRRDDPAALVEVLVRPWADYLRLGSSPRAWVKISAELAARPGVTLAAAIGHVPAIAVHAGATLHEHLAASMGSTLATERILAVTTASHHLCADRARDEDAGRPAPGVVRPRLPFEAWRANLLDMAVAAVLAPVRAR